MKAAALLTISILSAAIVAGCSQKANTISNASLSPATTLRPTPTPAGSPLDQAAVSPSKTVSSSVRERFSAASFPYSCKNDGSKTVASFDKKILPRNGNVVVGAIRDVIGRCFGEEVDVPPHIAGVGAEQVIRVESRSHRYVIVPIKSDAGEIHSLIITQLTD
jgi:hypothetical protein